MRVRARACVCVRAFGAGGLHVHAVLQYMNNDGERTLRSYSRPVNLAAVFGPKWATVRGDVFHVAEFMVRLDLGEQQQPPQQQLPPPPLPCCVRVRTLWRRTACRTTSCASARNWLPYGRRTRS